MIRPTQPIDAPSILSWHVPDEPMGIDVREVEALVKADVVVAVQATDLDGGTTIAESIRNSSDAMRLGPLPIRAANGRALADLLRQAVLKFRAGSGGVSAERKMMELLGGILSLKSEIDARMTRYQRA